MGLTQLQELSDKLDERSLKETELNDAKDVVKDLQKDFDKLTKDARQLEQQAGLDF